MKILAAIGIVALVLLFAAAVLSLGGFYNVAATRPDPAAVDGLLLRIREASISRHAVTRSPIALDDAATIAAGARAFAVRRCADCHGGPGVPRAKYAEGLRPAPPDLKQTAPLREPRELFWIIRNGINRTAMPGFAAAQMPDAEIWTIVAFLKKLPTVTDAEYRTWTAGG
jgi:mono/diheme cytochrome c family protein